MGSEPKKPKTQWVRVRVVAFDHRPAGMGWAEWRSDRDVKEWWVSFDDHRAYHVPVTHIKVQLHVDPRPFPPKWAERTQEGV